MFSLLLLHLLCLFCRQVLVVVGGRVACCFLLVMAVSRFFRTLLVISAFLSCAIAVNDSSISTPLQTAILPRATTTSTSVQSPFTTATTISSSSVQATFAALATEVTAYQINVTDEYSVFCWYPVSVCLPVGIEACILIGNRAIMVDFLESFST